MVTKIYKIIFFCLFVFYQNILHSKSLESPVFNEKNLYNYFSALVALDKNQNYESLKFFNSSKYLKESHESYIKKYIFSLIQSGKIKKAVHEIKTMKNEKFIDFFESCHSRFWKTTFCDLRNNIFKNFIKFWLIL